MEGDVSGVDPVARWETLDDAWQEAFRLAWEAATTGNIGVGAVIADETGTIVTASRNRVSDRTAPPGRSPVRGWRMPRRMRWPGSRSARRAGWC